VKRCPVFFTRTMLSSTMKSEVQSQFAKALRAFPRFRVVDVAARVRCPRTVLAPYALVRKSGPEV
jgi:hypothetical protein